MPDKFSHENENATVLGQRVIMELAGHKANPEPQGKQKQETYYNYLIGNDPSKHASNVALFKEAMVKNVYEGIDVRYYFDKGFMRYDFVVNPGANPAQIKMKYTGQNDTYLKNGSMCYTTRFGEVQMAELKSIQNGKEIKSHFVKNGDTWTFTLADYDKNQTLVIDPLVYSTYIGGSGSDGSTHSKVDAIGCIYVVGWSLSNNFDVTPGAFCTTSIGSWDTFVAKLNSAGNNLIYSTYLGGSNSEEGRSLTIDASGNVYIAGYTWSSDYPVTAGAFQTVFEGGNEVYVTKLNTIGTALVYSTYIGGPSYEGCTDIALDLAGNAYIAGTTYGLFDITAGAYKTIHSGSSDVYVTKINPTGSALVYSTYLGGFNGEAGLSIAVDVAGNAFVAGETSSTNFDVTPSAFQTTYAGGAADLFVAKLNSSGSGLIYSTYIGGSGDDRLGFCKGLKIDLAGNVYITGYTNSTDFDVTVGSFQTINSGGYDAFITKLNPSGSALVFSSYIGGTLDDYSMSLDLDASGNTYITGYTNSLNYDVTIGAFQTINKGGTWDVFVTKINSSGTTLTYSTYLGESASDVGYSISIDTSGDVYVLGCTNSTNYPITAGAFRTLYAGGNDAFVTKLRLTTIPLPIELLSFNAQLVGNKVNLTWTTTQEIQNDYFVTEKSIDEQEWNEVVKTQGAGISNQTIDYQEIDHNPFNGLSYYRLKQVDFDGNFSYSNTVAVNFTPNHKLDIEIYPNPNNGQFTVKGEGNMNVQIFNMNGIKISEQQAENEIAIDMKNETSGIYLVKVLSGTSEKTFRMQVIR